MPSGNIKRGNFSIPEVFMENCPASHRNDTRRGRYFLIIFPDTVDGSEISWKRWFIMVYPIIYSWLVVWNIFYLSIIYVFFPSHWRTHSIIFFKMVFSPPTRQGFNMFQPSFTAKLTVCYGNIMKFSEISTIFSWINPRFRLGHGPFFNFAKC